MACRGPNIKDEGLCKLIKNSKVLKTLEVCFSDNVTDKLIEFAFDEKNTHKNKVLVITVDDRQIDFDEAMKKYNSPYVELECV